jgi:hypothetical protein
LRSDDDCAGGKSTHNQTTPCKCMIQRQFFDPESRSYHRRSQHWTCAAGDEGYCHDQRGSHPSDFVAAQLTFQKVRINKHGDKITRSNEVKMPFTGTFHQKFRVGRYATRLGGGLRSRCAADIRPEKIECLWPGRMARGKHTCIWANPAPARACGRNREPDRQGQGRPAGTGPPASAG